MLSPGAKRAICLRKIFFCTTVAMLRIETAMPSSMWRCFIGRRRRSGRCSWREPRSGSPTALCDRHPPGRSVDGSLEDWSADDAIQSGPLVQYFNRPAVQSHELQLASTPASIYSGWSDDHFYIAFKVAGLSQQDLRAAQN